MLQLLDRTVRALGSEGVAGVPTTIKIAVRTYYMRGGSRCNFPMVVDDGPDRVVKDVLCEKIPGTETTRIWFEIGDATYTGTVPDEVLARPDPYWDIEKVETGADGKKTVTFKEFPAASGSKIEMREGPAIVWDGASVVKTVGVGSCYSLGKGLKYFPTNIYPLQQVDRDVTYTTRSGTDLVRVSVEIDSAQFVGVVPRSVIEGGFVKWYLSRVEGAVLVFKVGEIFFEIKQQS
jgi:hypothetical protein